MIAQNDTITLMEESDTIFVIAPVVQHTATRSVIDGQTLNKCNTGQNLPFLLQNTPSLIATSDDGLGIGYTYFRVRGTDHTRINMTINDVPLNDSESQTVFWVNMTDMSNSMTNLNVQRGVGTSTNGSSAFGASINMETTPDTILPKRVNVEMLFNGGMYKTFREMIKADILLPKHWRLNMRLSKVNSDGYLYRAFSDLFSYHGSIGYYTRKTEVSLTAFGGSEKTYMAWDGVSADNLKTDRRYNPAGEYIDKDGNVAYYNNQTDNYRQQHYQLHFRQRLAPQWNLAMTLHYTHGGGYYEQMKADKKYSSFGLENYEDADGNIIKRSNFIRQKHLNNHFYGGVFSINYRSEPADLTIGGAVNHYLGQHYGLVSDFNYHTIEAHEYYRSEADKLDANIYAKTNYRVINKANQTLTLYGDLQYRYVYYHLGGINDEDLQKLYITKNYHFFNPKAGITYQDHGHQVYFNFAIANREPTRKNFTEAGEHDIPKAERLFDYELGYTYNSQKWNIGLNLYYMDYKNQLVLTGKYSDTGAYLTRNVPNSYRMGIELSGAWRPTSWFTWQAAITISRSRIKNYTDWVAIYDTDWNELEQQEINFGDVQIAFSPAVTFSNNFSFEYKGFTADIHTQVVSKQYLDNTMSEQAVLKPYTVTNLTLQYSLPLPEKFPEIRLLAQVNNLFNQQYESNGGNWFCQFTDGSRYYTPWYYAQAGINAHAGIVVKF